MSEGRVESPRKRMVYSAARMICERGVNAVGMRQIAADARSPRGSLQRYFPGGKTQVLVEAIEPALAGVVAAMHRATTEAADLPSAVAMIVAPWRGMLVDYDFTLGCPMAAFVVDASAEPRLRQEADDRFTWWRTSIETVYRTFGCDRDQAHDEAVLLVTALEGATLVSRAGRDAHAIDVVERVLVDRARLLTG